MKKIIIFLLTIYQKYISPLFPPACRYSPTCSQYMKEAVEKHGVVKGILMGGARILRCHPYANPGEDPVPDTFSLKRNTPNHS